jgi:EpsI family protein
MSRFFVIIFILLLAAIGNQGFSAVTIHPERQPLAKFPETIGNWLTVDEQVIEGDAMAILDVDDYVMRTYANEAGDKIGLYVGYFETQQGDKEIHSPDYCVPAAGWQSVERKQLFLPLSGYSSVKIPVNLYLVTKGSQKQLFIWWYQARGRTYASDYLNRFYLLWDAITKHRTDGALVRVNTAVHSDVHGLPSTVTSFINAFFPLLPTYVPN